MSPCCKLSAYEPYTVMLLAGLYSSVALALTPSSSYLLDALPVLSRLWDLIQLWLAINPADQRSPMPMVSPAVTDCCWVIRDLKRDLKSGNTGSVKIAGFARLAVPSVMAPIW